MAKMHSTAESLSCRVCIDGRKHIRLKRLTGLMISTSSPDLPLTDQLS